MNILAITASLNPQGNSTQLVDTLLEQLAANNKTSQVIRRDVGIDTLPHLSGAELSTWAGGEFSAEQQTLAGYSETALAEVNDADLILIGVPMYNFAIPSSLKAYLDRLAVAGKSFRYTENGPQGLLENKKVVILAARGGHYQGTELDTQTPFLKAFFNFIGLSDIQFIYAEGLALGEDSATQSFAAANEAIASLAATL